MSLLLVALGGAAGAALRFLLTRSLDAAFPAGTVAVNIGGSFALGLLTGLAPGAWATALAGAGFCGALTTYSAFAVQAHDLGPRRGLALVVVTVPAALLACWSGFELAQA